MMVRVICGWATLRECDKLLHRKRFAIKLKGAVYKRYEIPGILNGREAWCLEERKIEFCETEISKVRAMCGVQCVG